jgi:response regulator RpfG family c-di-GMP phosphodiesterase
MDGFDVLQRIKEKPACKDIPVFVLTSKDLSDREIASLRARAEALIPKSGPWRDELLRKITSSVKRPRAVTANA